MITSQTHKRIGRTVATTVLSFSLAFSSLNPSIGMAQATTTQALQLQEQKTIAHGITHQIYTKLINSQTVKIQTVKANLAHQYVKIGPMFGTSIGSKDTVTTMAKQEGAVAALNASFFNMNNEGGTFGTIVKDGQIISNPDKQNGWNSFALLSDKTAIIQQLGFTGQVKAPNGNTFALEGINKTEYWPNNSPASNYSGTIHMFTRDWGPTSRGKLPGYNGIVEVEVTDGIVTDIRKDQAGRAIPHHGYVLMAHGNGAKFLEQNFTIGDIADVTYQLTPNVNVEQAIGANYLLVNQGQHVSTSHVENNLKGRNSRSALGISRDGKTLILVSIDKVGANPGVTLDELSNILIELGSYKAVNLDGGGSTSMVVRAPGQVNATRVNETTWERAVADALGIFNIAPIGTPREMSITGANLVMPNDTIAYKVYGFDSNYHPISNANVTYKVSDPTATLSNNQIKFPTSGRFLVQANYNGTSVDLPVRVIGANDIKRFEVSPTDIVLFPGQKQDIKATLHLQDGRTFTLKPEHIQLQNINQHGLMNNLTFQAGQNESKGQVQANVLGLTTNIDIEVGYTFRDIREHWAQSTIEKMAKLGYAKGISLGEFGPSLDVKRADFLVFLSRIQNWRITDKENGYPLTETVPAYAESAIKYALYHGIIKGDHKGQVNAYAPISRMEMATILQRILSAQANPPERVVQTPMSDLYTDWEQTPDWAKGAVQYVSERKIFGGMNGKFYPRHYTTRAEVMSVLDRAFIKK